MKWNSSHTQKLIREGRIKIDVEIPAEKYFEVYFEAGIPPSVGHYLKRTKAGVFKTEQAKEYQEGLGKIAKKARAKLAAGRISVKLLFWLREGELDIDNGLKVIFDSLHGIAWIDDSQIKNLFVVIEDRGDKPAGVEIKISRCPEFTAEFARQFRE